MIMKQWIFGILLLLSSTPVFAIPQTDNDVNDFNALTPEDRQLLEKIIRLVDEGLNEAVAPDFDYLIKKYPDNYLVQYEQAYNFYFLGQYDKVIEAEKKLLGSESVSELTYQLIGNSYDMLGNRDEAIKIYQEGLKRFPQSGSLYLELGNIYNMSEDYDKALQSYNSGILVQPDFSSNYYRAAPLYIASESAKVWGLVYAETAVLLAPSNDARHKEMSEDIIFCLKENIKLNVGDSTVVSVKLVPGRDMEIDAATQKVYLGFPGIYEGAFGRPLMKMLLEKQAFTCSLSQLIEIRKGMLENYFDVTNNLYGNSMYLLEFQKKILDAGHWDAYNYFLFMESFPELFDEWYDANSSAFDAFAEWYDNNPFTLGDGRSVNPMQIFDNYHPVDLMEAISIQAELLTDKPSKK